MASEPRFFLFFSFWLIVVISCQNSYLLECFFLTTLSLVIIISGFNSLNGQKKVSNFIFHRFIGLVLRGQFVPYYSFVFQFMTFAPTVIILWSIWRQKGGRKTRANKLVEIWSVSHRIMVKTVKTLFLRATSIFLRITWTSYA